jgi:hypothetical protein
MDWRHGIILRRLAEGCTYREAAAAASITRQGLWKRLRADMEFAERVVAAREAGKDERTFRLWLRHPFRGRRPPSGKGHGGIPRFSYGRR